MDELSVILLVLLAFSGLLNFLLGAFMGFLLHVQSLSLTEKFFSLTVSSPESDSWSDGEDERPYR